MHSCWRPAAPASESPTISARYAMATPCSTRLKSHAECFYCRPGRDRRHPRWRPCCPRARARRGAAPGGGRQFPGLNKKPLIGISVWNRCPVVGAGRPQMTGMDAGVDSARTAGKNRGMIFFSRWNVLREFDLNSRLFLLRTWIMKINFINQ